MTRTTAPKTASELKKHAEQHTYETPEVEPLPAEPDKPTMKERAREVNAGHPDPATDGLRVNIVEALTGEPELRHRDPQSAPPDEPPVHGLAAPILEAAPGTTIYDAHPSEVASAVQRLTKSGVWFRQDDQRGQMACVSIARSAGRMYCSTLAPPVAASALNMLRQ
jgi:hypothetical protein